MLSFSRCGLCVCLCVCARLHIYMWGVCARVHMCACACLKAALRHLLESYTPVQGWPCLHLESGRCRREHTHLSVHSGPVLTVELQLRNGSVLTCYLKKEKQIIRQSSFCSLGLLVLHNKCCSDHAALTRVRRPRLKCRRELGFPADFPVSSRAGLCSLAFCLCGDS